MKKTAYLALLAATSLFAACDYNEKFDGWIEGHQPTDVKKFDYTLTAEDYKAIAENKANIAAATERGELNELKALTKTMQFTEKITAAEYIPAFLYAKWFTADNSSAIRVSYNLMTMVDQKQWGENFETLANTTVKPANIPGWNVSSTLGTAPWESRFRNSNHYLQVSAFGQNGAAQTYAITPAISIAEGYTLSFEALYGNYKAEGGRLSLLVKEGEINFDTENVDEIEWTKDLTSEVSIEVPTATYGDFKPVAHIDLSAYKGKKVHFAFRYDGDGSNGATTTIQLDNVAITKKVPVVTTEKDQFARSGDVWMFDPSATILLYPTKNPTTVAYFQAGVDWVKENIDAKLGVDAGKGYVTSYGNNEYYSGLSAYYGNVDVRASKAREQYPAGFEGMDDAQISALLEQHLQETLAGALEKLHPDAVPVTGIDVIYTFRIGVYTGTSLAADQLTHEIKFKCTDKGKFTYVEGSYKKL